MKLLDKLLGRSKKAPKKDPDDVWERVPGYMERTPVPGGWLYRKYFAGHSVSIAFVPNMDEVKALLDRLSTKEIKYTKAEYKRAAKKAVQR